MALELKEISEQLKHVKEYLVKLGPIRRSIKVKQEKLNEATSLYTTFLSTYEIINEKLIREAFKSSDIKEIELLCENIKLYFNRITILCSLSEEPTEPKMDNLDKFELKTALSLLPVMNGEESVTKQLIDSIEYYETTLKAESNSQLITFVLKNRLSQSAKLQLVPSYSSVSDLVKDMKKELLAKKSANAIQSRLLSFKQNELTIEQYGKHITDMFNDLTISQADGKDENYKVLKPLNEKQAIRRFADGLRNRRTSTIISARGAQTSEVSEVGRSEVNLEQTQRYSSSGAATIKVAVSPTSEAVFDRFKAIEVAGWGLTGHNGKSAVSLQVIDYPVVDYDTCSRNVPDPFKAYITGDKICAGFHNAGKSLCEGDSGGGLTFPSEIHGTTRYFLQGIVSTAPNPDIPCNTDSYTTFTLLKKYEDFIQQFW